MSAVDVKISNMTSNVKLDKLAIWSILRGGSEHFSNFSNRNFTFTLFLSSPPTHNLGNKVSQPPARGLAVFLGRNIPFSWYLPNKKGIKYLHLIYVYKTLKYDPYNISLVDIFLGWESLFLVEQPSHGQFVCLLWGIQMTDK